MTKKCEIQERGCSFMDYSDLRDCADERGVKCRIIDYTPLRAGYMEVN